MNDRIIQILTKKKLIIIFDHFDVVYKSKIQIMKIHPAIIRYRIVSMEFKHPTKNTWIKLDYPNNFDHSAHVREYLSQYLGNLIPNYYFNQRKG